MHLNHIYGTTYVTELKSVKIENSLSLVLVVYMTFKVC